MVRRWWTALVLPLALASCADDGEGPPRPEPPRSVVIESFPAEQSPPPQGLTNAVVDPTVRPARLTVTAWGTPGCMRYPVSVAWRDEQTVQVTTAMSENDGCSAEYLPVSQVVVLPVEHAADGVRTVEVDGRSVAFAFEEDG